MPPGRSMYSIHGVGSTLAVVCTNDKYRLGRAAQGFDSKDLMMGYLLDNSCRIAYGDTVGGNIVDDDTAGAYRHVVADGHSGQNGDATAYPHIMADGHGARPFLTGVALRGVCTVTSRVDADVGTNEAVVADGHESLIEDYKIEVGEEASAYSDVLSVVAVKRLVDEGFVVAAAKYLLQHGVALADERRTNLIVLPAEVFASIKIGEQSVVDSIVDLATKHLFVFCGGGIHEN